ncbi:MAG: glycosyltransferase [Candidatus Acidiferrales bacterium]|jgi:processive 1,2-diacylglycerol beta-glucosyltransferase
MRTLAIGRRPASPDDKPRVLILSASSGEGHVRAGKALAKAFGARNDCVVEHIDALDYTSKSFQKIYDDAYIKLVRRAPGMLGWFFSHIDRPWRHQGRRLALDRLNTQPMIRLLKRIQPDVCVSTHFLPAEIVGWLNRKKKIRTRQAVVVTDFDVHAMWLCRGVDRYFVAVDEAAEYLVRLGMDRDSISATGIPIDPVFAEPQDARAIRMQFGLDPCAITVLVAAGGHALAPVEQLVTDLLALDLPWQIVAITGHATQIKQRLDKLAAAGSGRDARRARLHVVGYTEEMHLWMAASDLLAGKAGGLTVSESMASGLPMAIAGVLPGPQEERNAEHLLERGAAIRCHNMATAAWKIAELLDDPARLAAMRAAAKKLGRQRAAIDIAEACVRMAKSPAHAAASQSN